MEAVKNRTQFIAVLETASPILTINNCGGVVAKDSVFRFSLLVRDLNIPKTEAPKMVRVYKLKVNSTFAELANKVKIVPEETVVAFCRQHQNFLGTDKTSTFFRVSEGIFLRVKKLSDGLHITPYNINDNIVWQARFNHKFVF